MLAPIWAWCHYPLLHRDKWFRYEVWLCRDWQSDNTDCLTGSSSRDCSASYFTLITVQLHLLETYRTLATTSLTTKSTVIFKSFVSVPEGESLIHRKAPPNQIGGMLGVPRSQQGFWSPTSDGPNKYGPLCKLDGVTLLITEDNTDCWTGSSSRDYSASYFTLITVRLQLLETYRTQATTSLTTKSALIFKSPIGKIHPFSKNAGIVEPLMQLWYPLRFRMFLTCATLLILWLEAKLLTIWAWRRHKDMEEEDYRMDQWLNNDVVCSPWLCPGLLIIVFWKRST